MRKIFLDFGSNIGQGLNHFYRMYNMDNTWTVETFEPNPYLIEELKSNISNLPMNITVHNAAVWDQDGEVDFSIFLEDSNVNCMLDSDLCADPNSLSFQRHNHVIKVPCLSISNILSKFTKDDYVVVKLDIEGSEFTVLRKMIEDGTLDIVNEIYVEFHTKYISKESFDAENELKRKISESSVKLHGWW
jgi:FkbM family methyltransferase